MSIENGYWLIEPPFYTTDLDSEYVELNRIQSNSVRFAILSWVAHNISLKWDLQSRTFRLSVIYAEYMGKYPCLAVQGPIDEPETELGRKIENEVSRQLREGTVSDLVQFLAAHQPNDAELDPNVNG